MKAEKQIKKVKVTVRLEEEDYVKIQTKASKDNINISEYIRKSLLNEGKNQSIVYTCNIATLINKFLYKYEIEEQDKEQLEREVEKLWQLLK